MPEDGKQYVAGVDVAGRVVEDGKPILNDRDETVITIAEVIRGGAAGVPERDDPEGPRSVDQARLGGAADGSIERLRQDGLEQPACRVRTNDPEWRGV